MKVLSLNGELAWAIIAYYIIENKKFRSVTGIVYEAKVGEHSLSYRGGSRNNGDFEDIEKRDFMSAFDAVQKLSTINTNTIKNLVPPGIYRKRTPFIGLLFSAKVIK